MNIFYRIGWLFFKILFTVVWRIDIVGRNHIPRRGPVILASNHRSNADPMIVGSSIQREVYYLAKEELFRIPVLGLFIKLVNGIPLKRYQTDVSALKSALEVLKNGSILLVFPEGHRNREGVPLKPKQGVSMLAHMSKAPVIPTAVINTGRIYTLKRIRVIFGKPLYSDNETSEMSTSRDKRYYQFTEKVMGAIAELYE